MIEESNNILDLKVSIDVIYLLRRLYWHCLVLF